MFEYLNLLSGSAFSMATLFALGISPYITASIVMQLLTVAIPALERLQKEGPEGQRKIMQITRYVTVGLALITSYGYYMMLSKYGLLTVQGVFPAIIIIVCYCAGSAIVMWLGERINEKGIGNGISIILFANIVSGGFEAVTTISSYFGKHTLMGYLTPVIAIIIGIAITYFIVFITESERRLPVVYAKRVIGRKMYGGQNTNLPIKLNMSGVMPVIFANAILAIPATLAMIIVPKKARSGIKPLISYQAILGFIHSYCSF